MMVPLRPGKRSDSFIPPKWQQARFDAESGQVFTETSVRAASRQHLDWKHELKTPLLQSTTVPSNANASGARSLADIARTKVIRTFRFLTQDHFSLIPWELAEKIWQEAVEEHRDSFHAWTVLASSYPGADEFGLAEYRYHLEVRQPSLPLETYLDGLAPAQSPWLLTLRLSPGETRIADLMLLAKAENLAVLDLSDGQVSFNPQASSLDERVMRTWSELASTGSFAQLRVLLLGWQANVDQWLFGYLASFPNLEQLILTDCPKLHQKNRKEWEGRAAQYGWEARHSKRSAKSLRPYLKEPDFALGAVSGLYYTTLHDGGRAHPMVECWIGMPRKWLHIVDDFPGTRTVYFDRRRLQERTALTSNGGTKRVRHPHDHLPQLELGVWSASSSPERKRMQKPRTLRPAAVAAAAGTGRKQELDDLLSHYQSSTYTKAPSC